MKGGAAAQELFWKSDEEGIVEGRAYEQCVYEALTVCCCTNAIDDFMLCKAENRDPGHCLKEGRRVTRCAQDLCVFPLH